MGDSTMTKTASDALVSRLQGVTDTACAYFPDEVMAMCKEAAGVIRHLEALANFERAFRIATDEKLGEVLGRKS